MSLRPTASGNHIDLPPSILRSIGDKTYERRKHAALEVEQLVAKTLAASDNEDQQTNRIFSLVDTLSHEFATSSTQSNARKGGLLCIAAVAVSLNGHPLSQSSQFIERVVPPILNACTEASDSRLRYYALESMYNIVKSTNPAILSWLNPIFDVLYRLTADPDTSVQNASSFLSELIKDVCVAHPETTISHLDSFIPELLSYLNTVDTSSKRRQFLLGYVALLDSIPLADQHLLHALPQFLPSLLLFLSDTAPEVRQSADNVLTDFLSDAAAAPQRTNVNELANVLTERLLPTMHHTAGVGGGGDGSGGLHGYSTDGSSSPVSISKTPYTTSTALRWLETLVQVSEPTALGPSIPSILRACLKCIDTLDPGIQTLALQLNSKLLSRKELRTMCDAEALLDAAAVGIGALQETAKLESLKWTAMLLQENKSVAVKLKPTVLNALIDALESTSYKVVQEAAAVLAALSTVDTKGFTDALSCILDSFRGTSGSLLLQRHGIIIIERICCELGAERVLSTFSSLLCDEDDAEFARIIAQTLNFLLLTSNELKHTRSVLLSASTDHHGRQLFESLYPGFCRSTSAALALTLLCENYSLVDSMVRSLARPPLLHDIASSIVELGQLVTLLEAPVFASLRLNLLNTTMHNEQHASLHRVLYSILMILPQGDAFKMLNQRLQCVPAVRGWSGGMVEEESTTTKTMNKSTSNSNGGDGDGDGSSSNLELLDVFMKMQGKRSNS